MSESFPSRKIKATPEYKNVNNVFLKYSNSTIIDGVPILTEVDFSDLISDLICLRDCVLMPCPSNKLKVTAAIAYFAKPDYSGGLSNTWYITATEMWILATQWTRILDQPNVQAALGDL
jgi:hypothetical protein